MKVLLFFVLFYTAYATEFVQILPASPGTQIQVTASSSQTTATNLLYGAGPWISEDATKSGWVDFVFNTSVPLQEFICVTNGSYFGDYTISGYDEFNEHIEFYETNRAFGYLRLLLPNTYKWRNFRFYFSINEDSFTPPLQINNVIFYTREYLPTLEVEALGDKWVDLKWDNVNASFYFLLMGTNDISFVLVNQNNITFEPVTSLSPLSSYYFKICAQYSVAQACSVDTLAVTTAGRVVSLAGGSTIGEIDGTGDEARFSYPKGMVYNPLTQTLHVVGSSKLRSISMTGQVSTLNAPHALANGFSLTMDDDTKTMYIADSITGIVRFNGTDFEIIIKSALVHSNLVELIPVGIMYLNQSQTLVFVNANTTSFHSWLSPFVDATQIQTLYSRSSTQNPGQFTIDKNGDFYLPVNTQIIKINAAGGSSVISGTNVVGSQNGKNPTYSIITSLCYSKGSESIFVTDNAGVRALTKYGYATAVMKNGNTFIPGMSSIAQLKSASFIYAHPEVDKFFFISDSSGVRILYGAPPPIAIIEKVDVKGKDLEVKFKLTVPIATITQVVISVSVSNIPIQYLEILESPSFLITDLEYNTNYTLNALFSNEYGNGLPSADISVMTSKDKCGGCVNGTCLEEGKCKCDAYFTGDLCDTMEIKVENVTDNSFLLSWYDWNGNYDITCDGTPYMISEPYLYITGLSPLTLYHVRVVVLGTPINVEIRVSTSGKLKSLSGATDSSGNSTGVNSLFSYPSEVAFDPISLHLYFADNGVIKRVGMDGKSEVVPVLGLSSRPIGLDLDTENNCLYVALLYGLVKVNLADFSTTTLISMVDTIGGGAGNITFACVKYNHLTKEIYLIRASTNSFDIFKLPAPFYNTGSVIFNSLGNAQSIAIDSASNIYTAAKSTLGRFNNVGDFAQLGAIGGFREGRYPIFESAVGFAYWSLYDSVLITDPVAQNIRVLTNDSYGSTVIKSSNNQGIFVPGTGSNVGLADLRFITAHPLAAKYFFVTDEYGIRVLYGSAPPKPRVHLAQSFVQDQIIITIIPSAPLSTITNFLVTISWEDEVDYLNTTELNIVYQGKPNIAYNITIQAINEYGASEPEQMQFNLVGACGGCNGGECKNGECICSDGWTGNSTNCRTMIVKVTDLTDKSVSLKWPMILGANYVIQYGSSYHEYSTIGGFSAIDLLPLTLYNFSITATLSGLTYSGSIRVFTSGQVASVSGSLSGSGNRIDLYSYAGGVAFDTNNWDIYVTDSDNNRIKKIAMTGETKVIELDPTIMNRPIGIDFSQQNNLLVCSYNLYQINITDLSMELLAQTPCLIVKYRKEDQYIYYSENDFTQNYYLYKMKQNFTTQIYHYSDGGGLGLSTYGFAHGKYGEIYTQVGSKIVKRLTNGINVVLANTGEHIDGNNPSFAAALDFTYLAKFDSVLVADSSSIRLLTSDGFATTVVGSSVVSNVFNPGQGNEAKLVPLKSITPHPFVDNYYFFTDSFGVRVLYGAPPPPPKVIISNISNNYTFVFKLPVPIASIGRIVFTLLLDGQHTLNEQTMAFSHNIVLEFQSNYTFEVYSANEYGPGPIYTTSIITPDCNSCNGRGKCNISGGCTCFGYYNNVNNCSSCTSPRMDINSNCTACSSGYFNFPTCSDNPCDVNNGGCDNRTICTGSTEGAKCGNCPTGFSGTGTTGCQDINECLVNNGDCSTYCNNTIGSHFCSCDPGYTIASRITCVDINECNTNNGGCDHHVICENKPGNFSCPPCPFGYTGNSYNASCIAQCGNGLCEPNLSENCVSCPLDCTNITCNSCGDGTCNGGETCTTCYQDCKQNCVPVNNCGAQPYCSGNGNCVDGQCKCRGDFSGPVCSVRNANVSVDINTTVPSVGISSGAKTSFQVAVQAIKELDTSGTTITQYLLTSTNFTYEELNISSGAAWTYITRLDNTANISILLQQFVTSTELTFANTTFTMAPNMLKMNVKIADWPFKSIQNSLEIVFQAQDSSQNVQSCNIDAQTDSSNSLQSFVISIGGSALYGQFIDKAIVDNKNRVLSFRLNNTDGTISTLVPHFWTQFEMDPNFGVLLEYDTKDNCAIDETKQNKKKVKTAIIAGVVGGIGGAAVLAAIAFFTIPKIRTWWKTKKASESIHLEDLKSSRDDVVIEKASDMEINTASGRFIVKF